VPVAGAAPGGWRRVELAGFLIDQAPYRADEIAFSVSRGAREIWEIRNSPISMPHPCTCTASASGCCARQGTYGDARRLATEPGGPPGDRPRREGHRGAVAERDAVAGHGLHAAAGGRVPRVPQRFMFHCHNLEHEDGMMMRNFTVV